MASGFMRGSARRSRGGVCVGESGVALALVVRSGDAARLTHYAHHDEVTADWQRSVADVASGAELRKVPVTGVVAAGDYQLVLVEVPQVPREEVAAAVRWRIKDLVGFSTDDAVIDTIDIPELANRSTRPMLYAVAAEATAMHRQVDAICNAGLRLDAVDIPEMCLRNIAIRTPQEQRGVALIHFEENHGTLILSRAGTLYLIRRIETGMRAIREWSESELSAGDLGSDIALEAQRSLDYFESHYDQRPINQIILGPGTPPRLVGALAAELGLDVNALDLNDIVESDSPIPAETQPEVLIAIGAALRSDQPETVAA